MQKNWFLLFLHLRSIHNLIINSSKTNFNTEVTFQVPGLFDNWHSKRTFRNFLDFRLDHCSYWECFLNLHLKGCSPKDHNWKERNCIKFELFGNKKKPLQKKAISFFSYKHWFSSKSPCMTVYIKSYCRPNYWLRRNSSSTTPTWTFL